jgi:hypothetical protein
MIKTRTYDNETDYLFEEVEVGSQMFSVNTTVGFNASREDVGIGPYEFWGAKGNDVRIETVVEDFGIVSVDEVRDENDEVVTSGVVAVEDVEKWLGKFYGTLEGHRYRDNYNPARWFDEFIDSEADKEFSE